MQLKLNRKELTSKSTIGELLINDEFFCYVLEDVVRAPGVKVKGQTAIPVGTYEVVIDMSARFKKLMPHILDVPMFEGIRIHSGNKAEDTEGCLLLGISKSVDFVGRSKEAFDLFFHKLVEGLKEGKVFITIS